MSQIEVMSRLVDWFCDQPPEVQGVVQKHYSPEITREVAAALKGAIGKTR